MDSSYVLSFLNEHRSGNYTVEKLKTKYDSYSSFKVGVPAPLLTEIYSPEFWPTRTFISRFKFPKNPLNYQAVESKEGT